MIVTFISIIFDLKCFKISFRNNPQSLFIISNKNLFTEFPASDAVIKGLYWKALGFRFPLSYFISPKGVLLIEYLRSERSDKAFGIIFLCVEKV